MRKTRRKEKKLSLAQVSQLERRREELGYTLVVVRAKFDAALRARDCVLSDGALKARVDRIFNARMRGPLNAENKMALAQTLDWTVAELERELRLRKRRQGHDGAEETGGERGEKLSVRQIAHMVAVELETHQISRGVDLKIDNLRRVYQAAYVMFQRIRALMGQLPVEELRGDAAAMKISDTLAEILNESLRPHLTIWRERYERWEKHFSRTATGKKLSPQELLARFPEREALRRDLRKVTRQLQTNACRLRSLVA